MIEVLGHNINVKKNLDKKINHDGNYQEGHHLIRLNVDVPESSIAECFLHEILEVIRIKLNINIDHDNLTVLSEVLFDVLRQNDLCFGDSCVL